MSMSKMSWNRELDALFQDLTDEDWEIESFDVVVSAVNVVKEQTPYKVTSALITHVCNDITKDPCITENLLLQFKSLNSEEIVPAYTFLENCVSVDAKGVNREKSWSLYHKSYINNIEHIIQVTKSAHVASWLGYELFSALMSLNLKECTSSKAVEPLDTMDREITHYVGGSIIKKLYQRTYRLKNGERKDTRFTVLNNIKSTLGSSTSSLINLLDRGGLTKLHEPYILFFESLEKCFRTLENDKICAKKYDFVSAGFAVSDNVQNDMKKVCPDQETVVRMTSEMIQLFFKIRVLHRCRKLMDQYRQKRHLSRKEKSLRKKLKTNDNADCKLVIYEKCFNFLGNIISNIIFGRHNAVMEETS